MPKNVSKSTREFLVRQKLKKMGYSDAVVDKYAHEIIRGFKIDLRKSLDNIYEQLNILAHSKEFNLYMNNKHTALYGQDAPKPTITASNKPRPEPQPTNQDEYELRTRPLPKPSPYK